MARDSGLRIGIDASNLRRGGGITHLREVLAVATPADQGIARVVVWGARETLDVIAPRPWLELVHVPALDQALPRRLLWQRRRLAAEARARCDLLWAPGGGGGWGFHPYVTMSRNMLPFDPPEARRYRGTLTGLRLSLLSHTQRAAFRRAAGVIFLTQTAKETVLADIGALRGAIAVVPHGIADRFRLPPRPQAPLDAYEAARPFRWLYVSIIDRYKHQWHVVDAVRRLRDGGLPVRLDLVGPGSPDAVGRLQAALRTHDPRGAFTTWHGGVPYEQLAALYQSADASVFASTCENMPNIVLESMAAGLALACTDRGVMPEVLGDGGVYFAPEDPAAMARAMETLMRDPVLRARCAQHAFDRALQFTWQRCARETFTFLASVARPDAQATVERACAHPAGEPFASAAIAVPRPTRQSIRS